jgi:VanZ family protein
MTLAVLSLVPGDERPHTGLAGQYEHVMAYALAGFVTRLAGHRIPSRWQLVAFSLAAGAFEICQIWIPGRSPAVIDWLASSIGALIGIAIGRQIAHAFFRSKNAAGGDALLGEQKRGARKRIEG